MKRYATTLILLIFSLAAVSAATYTWDGGAEADYDSSASWSPTGVPGSADIAIFNPTGETIVNFSDDEFSSELRIQGEADGATQPNVTFDLGGNVYRVTSGSGRLNFLVGVADSVRSLNVKNGELSVGTGLVMWGYANVEGAETILRIQEGGVLRHTAAAGIGRTESSDRTTTAKLYIENGGKLLAENSFSIAANGGNGTSNADVFIIGPTSVMEAKASDRSVVNIGNALGHGTLRITDGGLLDSSRAIGVGFGEVGTAALTVSGVNVNNSDPENPITTASRILGNQLYIGGGRARDDGNNLPRAGGEGVAEFLDGGYGQFTTLLAYNNSVNGTKGTLRIDDAFVTVSGTATFQAGSVTELGLRSVEQDVLMFASNLVLDSTLQLLIDGSFSAALHDSIHLIEYTSLTGTFAGLGEGDTFSVDGHTFSIHYAMGDGENIIGLTVIPEPGTIAVILGAICLGICVARRKLSQRAVG